MRTLTALLAATLLLAGCSGSSDDEPAPSEPTTAQTTSAEEQVRKQTEEQAAQQQAASDELADKVAERAGAVSIVIKDGKVTPQGDRVEVKVGQQVTLKITSDADEEIHVHSDPEHTYEVAAGESISESFTIDTPGQVAVEAHHLDVTIVQLVVRP